MTTDTHTRRSARGWWIVACVVITVVAVLALRHWVVQPFHVPSNSMAPTLVSGEYILVDRSSRESAARGSVVVFDGTGYFRPSPEHGSGYWVKRVIGVGGDRVQCCSAEGSLIVNGSPVSEPYLAPGLARASAHDFDVVVPTGRIFVLGDARNNSTDSRDHLGAPGGGMIPQERVVGHVTRVVWPIERGRPVRDIR